MAGAQMLMISLQQVKVHSFVSFGCWYRSLGSACPLALVTLWMHHRGFQVLWRYPVDGSRCLLCVH